MTPKEKAKQLVDRFFDEALPDAVENHFHIGVLCALITVDEILEELNHLPSLGYGMEYQDNINYWQEVKQEIEKL